MAYAVIKAGEKEIPMLASAATPKFFWEFFHKDLIGSLNKTNVTDEEIVGLIPELAFIMAKNAEGSDMFKLTQADYYSWLEGFEPFDLIGVDTAMEILKLYSNNADTRQSPKKKRVRRNAK